MRHYRSFSLWLIGCVLPAAPALACLWDYDTLRDERRGLPGVAEILAGQWERHSAFFYHHRVEQMKARLATHPEDQAAMDNLAVAYEKIDHRAAAIAVMLDKEKRFPGRYTTRANLGTFYIHQGKLDAGIEQLEAALEINPAAHFGREEYQLKLAKYLKAATTRPALAKDDFLELRDTDADGLLEDMKRGPYFMDRGGPWVLERLGVKSNLFQGLEGMLRFGTGKSPQLWFALGDILAAHGDKNLAYRAYLRAKAFGYPNADVIAESLQDVVVMQVEKGGLEPAVIAGERAAADKWVADYQAFEDDLIRSGKDADDEANLAPFYATHSRALPPPAWTFRDATGMSNEKLIPIVCAALAVGTVVSFSVRRDVRRRRKLLAG